MKIRKLLFGILFAYICSACGSDPVEDILPPPEDNGPDDTENEMGDGVTGDDIAQWPRYVTPPVHSGATKVVYSQTESTVNGQPFIPMGIYGVNEVDMPLVASYGYNLITSYQYSVRNSIEKQKLYLDTAYRNGLLVLVNLNGMTKVNNEYLHPDLIKGIKATVQTFKDHPAVYAWYLADEPYIKNVSVAALKELYDWIKAEDPYHPVMSSNWELNNFKECCDVDLPQNYNGVPSRMTNLRGPNNYGVTWLTINNSYDSNWGREGGKSLNPLHTFGKLATDYGVGSPQWNAELALWQPFLDDLDHPEAHGFYPSASFPNTLEELRSSIYWGFVLGSNGLLHWLWGNPGSALNLQWGYYTIFHQLRLRNQLVEVFREINELSKFLINPSEFSVSFRDESYPDIRVWSKTVDKQKIVIIVNATPNVFNEGIDLSQLYITSKTLQVYKEDGREIKLDGDILKDTFKKDEVHVYFVKD